MNNNNIPGKKKKNILSKKATRHLEALLKARKEYLNPTDSLNMVVEIIFFAFRMVWVIILFPINKIIDIKNKKLYSLYIKNKIQLSSFLLESLPRSLSAKVLFHERDSSLIKAKIITSLNKAVAWEILLELKDLSEEKFFEVLKCLDTSVLNDYLYFEKITTRGSILKKIGREAEATGENFKKDSLQVKQSRLHIEELYDSMAFLKKQSVFFYQYGTCEAVIEFFRSLSSVDQARLVFLAMSFEDRDIKKILNYIFLEFKSKEEILSSIEPQDKREIEEIILEHEKISSAKTVSTNNYNKKKKELQKAIELMQSLTVEEAFWVLLYNKKDAIWITATGIKNDAEDLSKIRFPNMVIYDPDKHEKYWLITSMRQAEEILHIHNHPKLPNGAFGSSTDDRAFAQYWRSYRPELSYKMQFYIIQDGRALEYGK